MEAHQFCNPNSGESKFRQLPCRTFLSMGACPYRDRCVYLHDPRLSAGSDDKSNKNKSRRKNKEDGTSGLGLAHLLTSCHSILSCSALS